MDFTGLLEPQKGHSINLLNSLYFNGVADDMSDTGVGKTYCACWIAKQLNCPVVVICPNSVKEIWRQTLAKFQVNNSLIINYERLIRGNTEYLTYDLNKFHRTPKWWLSEGIELHFRKDSFIIVDEQHRGRTHDSLTCDLLVALKNQKYKVLGLSATSATSVADMKAIGYKVNLHNGENYPNWCVDHGALVTRWGTINWDINQVAAQNGLKRIHENLFNHQKIASRLRREDFGNLFPENRVLSEVYDMGQNNYKLQAVYDQMQYELSLLDKRTSDYSNHVFAIIMEARRRSEILKTPTAVEFINDWIDEGMSAVVFCNFNDTVESLKRLLKKHTDKIGFLVGGQSEYERNCYIKDFQSDKLRIFIANMKAGNLGVSLHDLNGIYPRQSLIMPCWSAVDVIQSIGRIWRVKGQTPCIQRFFYANIPIEKRMANRIAARVNNLDCLNDGDLNLAYTFV